MNLAIHKTLAFAFVFILGLLLRRKFSEAKELNGLKTLILSIALPATIFVGLLTIEIKATLLLLPILALGFNGLMLGAVRFGLPLLGLAPKTPTARTLMLLLPSLAPGLSCFPYVMEYLGEEQLAWAALADVGNKVFVLILLYLLAMHWYHQRQTAAETGQRERIKDLLLSLVREPVNLVIVAGLLLVGLGFKLNALPLFVQDAVGRMSSLMTPLVLLFVALAVVIRRSEIHLIATLLCWRAGMAFCASALLLVLIPMPSPAAALLAVVFPLSACSFWPYAHMCAVQLLETKQRAEMKPLFDLDLALAVLAISLPFSTLLILTVCSVGSIFTRPLYVFLVGGGLLVAAGMSVMMQRSRQPVEETARPERSRLPKPQPRITQEPATEQLA